MKPRTNLSSLEGYFIMDHRQGPGVPDEVVIQQGLKPGAGHGLYESATYTCAHSQHVVIMNPDRSRPRYTCKGCGKVLCDSCAAQYATDGVCRNFNDMANQLLEKFDKGIAPSEVFQSPLIIP